MRLICAGEAKALFAADLGELVTLLRFSRLPTLLTIGQAQISREVRKNSLEITHDPTGVAPIQLAAGGKVTTIHDVIPFIYPETSTTLDWLIYRFWLPLAVRRLDAIITVSTQSKEDIVRFLPVDEDKITVVPLAAGGAYRPLAGNEVAAALQKYEISKPYILYVGSLESRKNLPRLLEAYAQLRRWSEQWTMVIVGARKWKYAPIFETVQRLGLEPYVDFTGYVEEEDLPALYNGADLFVFPSLYEGFGLPVLEAMACGTPVVTSNTSSLPEVAGDAALLVDPYDVEEIAAAMRSILEDEALAADLRERGLVRAKEFSWKRTARETIAVYEKVLGH
jgi:glycosyltransferase involved in cell wall biosynthesis